MLLVHGETVTSIQNIEQFNDFFNLTNKYIEHSPNKKKHYSVYLKFRNVETFFLSTTTPGESKDIIIEILDNSKCTGPESTLTKILEDIAEKISPNI